MLAIEFVEFPSWGVSIWKAFLNKWFFVPKRRFVFDLGLMAADRLGYLQKNEPT